MFSTKKPYIITRGKVLIDYARLYCDTPEKLLRSELFYEIVDLFIEKIASKGSSIFAFLTDALPGYKRHEFTSYLVNLFRILNSYTAEEISSMDAEYVPVLSKREYLHELVEELYNYWRRFERFIYLEAPKGSAYAKDSIHHARFIKSNEEFKNLVLYVYRRISENLTGRNPMVYRQLPAGANMGMLLERVDWNCPADYSILKEIPFIRLSLMEPPLIFYPVMNKRKGKFEEIYKLTGEMLSINSDEWFCYPARVGELTAFIFFHRDFISLGLSLCNLFEIADYADIAGKVPDIMLLFGITNNALPFGTCFYEDKASGVISGLIRHSEEVDYFGYFKKMTLTLHNIAMLNKGRLPIHGAMVYIKLKGGETANVVIIGDSGTGKSETLEALRTLSEEYICEMRTIFDDMGSIGVDGKGNIVGYGTEIGAFVRLDDLETGYAYEEIDRSIFMNPDKTNARLIIPITRYHHIIKGYPVNIVLYANNYDQTGDDQPVIEFFSHYQDALSVFRSGARLAKGTTDEKGMVHTYFANPFGASQRREEHEKQAEFYFKKMFECGITVGQIRTRLGIEGFEQIGPKAASTELLRSIQEFCSGS